MSGKRRLTKALAEKIADRLMLVPAERSQFFAALDGKKRQGASSVSDRAFQLVEADEFHVIADWYHFAILSLAETSGFTDDPAKIAGQLNISSVEARAALERLRRLGLLVGDGDQVRPAQPAARTGSGIPSSAIRRFHVQHLKIAEQRLAEVSVAERDYTGITMAIDPRHLPAAKDLIKRFRRELAELVESDQRTDVYHLAIQLYPLTGKNGATTCVD